MYNLLKSIKSMKYLIFRNKLLYVRVKMTYASLSHMYKYMLYMMSSITLICILLYKNLVALLHKLMYGLFRFFALVNSLLSFYLLHIL